MTLFFGQSASHSDVLRALKEPFRLLEIEARAGQLPKASKLGQWRANAPPGFVFSVVLSPECFGRDEKARQAIDYGLSVAQALDARFLVLRPPGTFRPSGVNERRLEELTHELSGHGFRVAWEPFGLWDTARARSLAEQLAVVRIQRLENFRPEPVAYVRLLQLGVGRSRLNSSLDELAAGLAVCDEAYVVIEGPGALRIYRELAGWLESAAEAGEGFEAEDAEDSDDEDFETEDEDEES